MAENLFTQKLKELMEAGAGKAIPGLDEAANLGKTNTPTATPTGIPPFPLPPESAKLLKPDEIKYLNSVPVDKRPAPPLVGGKPDFADRAFQTGYKTLLFDYRDQEAKRRKEAEIKALQAQAP
jgi:hypothetical protein